MSQCEASVVHVVGDDTPLGRLEALRTLYRHGERVRQRVVQFGGGRLELVGLGSIERVRVPLAIGRLARPALRDLLPSQGPAIVHVWSERALAWARRSAGVRLLIDIEPPRGVGRPAGVLADLASSRVACFACQTEAARRRLRAIGVASGDCALIRDSADLAGNAPADRSELRRQLDLCPQDAAVLILPPLRRETGSVIAAWGAMLLEHARPGVRVLVPDVGREAARVVHLAESCGLGRMLRVVRWRFDLSELLAAADLAVYLPTGDAPLWGVAHAMAAGRPIVASDVRVTRELLAPGRTAWLCRADDPRDACRAMLRALEEQALSDRQVRAARTQAGATFDRRRMIEQYRQVYQCLLANRPLDAGLEQVALVD